MTDESRKAFGAVLLELQKRGGFDLPYRVWVKGQSELAAANARIAELEAQSNYFESEYYRADQLRSDAEARLAAIDVAVGPEPVFEDAPNPNWSYGLTAAKCPTCLTTYMHGDFGLLPRECQACADHRAARKYSRLYEHYKHRVERLAAKNVRLADALLAAERVIRYAHACWDSDQDAKVGKLLITMLNDNLKYSDDCSVFRAAVREALAANKELT